MKLLISCAILAVVCLFVECQVPHLGSCPNVTVVENLDVNKYLGDWYEIRKFFFFIEGAETCIKANYSLKEDGHIRVYNKGLQSDGTEDIAIGDAVAEDPNVPAKLSVEFNNSPRVPYWIVDTDYDNYSLIWSCIDLAGVVQADFAWILSRKNTLDDDTVNKLVSKLASFGINTDSFRKTVQENCTY